ncbi:hypothetical protein GSI_03170 [Ganoderma sinense ZZ0214-1]|uniref:Uncharacterized protein n=1 Tax=Ganoderma sinense ZZ0214-1 TaxID=1077348 RepID=A0A2G8SKV4_9APHY|nr:hypothetical protein GSI_03170 [Ganoderma sinense ZZ0214-1]
MSLLPIIADSGAPEGSTNYTTIVLIHGYAWSSGVPQDASIRKDFQRSPYPRDYAIAPPYTPEERTELFAAAATAKTEPDAARPKLLAWIREDRAREVYDLLVRIMEEDTIPLSRPEANTGDITVAGSPRLRARPPPAAASPGPDIDSPPTDKQRSEVALFFSGYFKHGDVNDPSTYALTSPLAGAEALPTWRRLTQKEIELMYDPLPGDARGGTDSTLERAGMSAGVYEALREEALRLLDLKSPGARPGSGSAARGWDTVEVLHMWGDHSPAAMLWAV